MDRNTQLYAQCHVLFVFFQGPIAMGGFQPQVRGSTHESEHSIIWLMPCPVCVLSRARSRSSIRFVVFCIYPVHKSTGTLNVPCLRAFQSPVMVAGMHPQACRSTKPLDE